MIHPQLHSDLQQVFAAFPLNCLRHLRENHRRLVRRTYHTEGGHGCIMYLLSEPLEAAERIDSKLALMRYFGPAGGPQHETADAPEYQPARWIVRLWDDQDCGRRYGMCRHLSKAMLLEVLDEVIARREQLESEAETVRASALQRMSAAISP